MSGVGDTATLICYSGLMNCGFPSIASLAVRVDHLRKNRVDADYNLSLRIIQPDSLSLVPEGRAIVADFQSILTTLPPAKIADGGSTDAARASQAGGYRAECRWRLAVSGRGSKN